jgi:hypothetical protein
MSAVPRLLGTLAAAVVVLVAAPSAALAARSDVPASVPLTTGWWYAPDPQLAGMREGWSATNANVPWQSVRLPHVFDPTPHASEFHGTVGWYRLDFTAPARRGFSWALHFEQARRVAHVWLNGADLGTHSDPYVPFTLPATGLRAGGRNTLVVRVDNRKGKEPREGWWNWGGLTRPVELVPLGSVRMADLGLMPKLRCTGPDDCTAQVLVDGVVTNAGTTRTRPRVAVRLVAPGSRAVTQRTIALRPLDPGETVHVRSAIPVSGNPQLWSPEHPALYHATVRTLAGATPQQADSMDIGLRSVRVQDGELELNGRPLELRGASIQEDLPGRGPALTNADMDRIVAELQAVHANVTRAHYLLNERLLDKLDRAGIMVWSQAPIYHRDRLLETPAQRAAALRTLRGTVLGARSHPSVITHSVANELSVVPDTVPGTRAYLDSALGLVRSLDPTLPVSVDLLSYPGFPRQRTYARYDLIGINSYFGWYPGKPDHPTGNIADLEPYLRWLRLQYPTAAMVLTEFGAEATMNGPAAEKETYAFQSDYIQRVLGIVDKLPFMSGAIYWTLREFAVKPNWDGGAQRKNVARDAIHNKGLITYSGRPKPGWGIAERDFAATPLFRPPASPIGDIGTWDILLLSFMGAFILALLALDAWALAGILGFHRSERRRARFAGQPARVEAGP